MQGAQALEYFQERQADMLEVVRQHVEQETPSDDKPRLDAFADWLATRLRDIGADVEIVPNQARGNHVLARFGHGTNGHSANSDVPQALILCHFDTVWAVGSLETHPFRVEAGKAYGPGIFDMKSSLMLSEYALRAIHDLNLALPRPVTILMTSDEEVGSPTSRALIEQEACRSAYVLVMESPLPGGVLKTARKGSGGYELEIVGRAAHAGVEPEKGISAVQELAHQILRLHALNDYAAGTTVNVGVVAGGTVPNVVAGRARALINTRVWSAQEAERIDSAIKGLTPVLEGALLHVSGGPNRPPLEHSVTADLFERARTLAREQLEVELNEGSTGGGSDGNLTGALGIPTLDGLGVPGHGAHADHEHIEVDGIPERAALLVTLLTNL